MNPKESSGTQLPEHDGSRICYILESAELPLLNPVKVVTQTVDGNVVVSVSSQVYRSVSSSLLGRKSAATTTAACTKRNNSALFRFFVTLQNHCPQSRPLVLIHQENRSVPEAEGCAIPSIRVNPNDPEQYMSFHVLHNSESGWI